jgi:hypothetical protein
MLPNNKLTYILITIGFCFGVFSDEIQIFIYDVTYPLGVLVIPLLSAILFMYLGHRYPLSQAVRNEGEHDKS